MYKKKSLGQHFLRNKGILQKIVSAAKIAKTDTVLEVGPGEGTLTELLLPEAGEVIAVEKDDRLIPVLKRKFADEIASGKLKILPGDILDVSLVGAALSPLKTYKVVANLPYYITGQFLRTFLGGSIQPESMVLLLQKEVARRIVASDGRESLLSISVKAYGVPAYVDTVKAGAFSPPPRVDSAIIAITSISKDFFRDFDEDAFFSFLRKGFSHPRKMLASNLEVEPSMLALCGIAPGARAENLSKENWHCLCGVQYTTEG